MGHITTDRLDDAWRAFDRSESLVEESQEFGAVMKCKEGLEHIERSADGVGVGETFARRGGGSLLQDAQRLQRQNTPDPTAVRDLISASKDLLIDLRPHIVETLHTRLEDSDDDLYTDRDTDNFPTCSRIPQSS